LTFRYAGLPDKRDIKDRSDQEIEIGRRWRWSD